MIPFTEVAVLDRNAEYRGVPTEELMEKAGKALADEIDRICPVAPILFICGTGNNAGDAFVAARYLSETRGPENITVYLIRGTESIGTELSKKNLDLVNCKVTDELTIEEGQILVDGLLGTGIKGIIREPYRTVIKEINASSNKVISIDVPSGLGADICVEPEATVTFHDIKEGMNEHNSGEIIVKDIGIPKEAEEYTGPGELLLYPRAKEGSHKGDNGRVLVIGGGPYSGAPALVAMAAYRTGVDLVHLAVPSSVSQIVAGFSPSFIVHPLEGTELKKEHVEQIIELSKNSHAVVIGPGLGDSQSTVDAVRHILKKLETPVVVDADALKAIANGLPNMKIDMIITPHLKEFEMIAGSFKDKFAKADDYAKDNQITVLLKGHTDYVTDGKRYKFNDFGSPAMSVGGTGDTLAGVVAALLGKGLSPFDSARLGVYITTRAGESAFEKYAWGLMPEDISECIPVVLKELIK